MTTATRADTALERVQNLYGMQMRLLDLLDRDLRDPSVRKEVRNQMRDFEDLLAKADWRYMGGRDVWDTLQQFPEELAQKLKTSAQPVSRVRTVRKKKK